GHGVGRRDGSLSRRLARTVAAGVVRLDLVPAEGGRDSVLLRLDAMDAAAVPVRPADAVRLEGAAAAVSGQPAGHGGRGAVFRALKACEPIVSHVVRTFRSARL